MRSLSEFLNILKRDSTRDGVVVRKLLFESLTGSSVRDLNLLSQLAVAIGARKRSILAGACRRSKLETDHKLVPIVARLQRKSPEGKHVISTQWKLEVVGFFETDAISEVLKGHNHVYKVGYFYILFWVLIWSELLIET